MKTQMRLFIYVLSFLLVPTGAWAEKMATQLDIGPKPKAAAPAEKTTTRLQVSPSVKVLAPIDMRAPVITITSPAIKRGVKLEATAESTTVAGLAEDASGVASVTVNGQAASLDEKGNFATDILLKVGENSIVVTAMDVHKNTSTERFAIIRKMAKVIPEKKPPAEKMDLAGLMSGRDYALVIGINSYKHLDRLTTAVSDAKEIAKILKENYGFETRLILDQQATRDNILKELNALRRKVTSADRLLIYYAGHGEYYQDTDTSFWLPANADPSDTTDWIDAKSITDQLKIMNARHVLIVADSCYAGTLARKTTIDLSTNDIREQYLKKMFEKPSRVLIASGGNEPVADKGGGEHSIFASVFIRALNNPEKTIFTAEELHINHIKEEVAGRADQTPEYRVIRNSGHDGGDFVFVRKQ